MLANRTGQAILDVKREDKVGRSAPGFALRTAYTYFSLRTGHLFLLPIDLKLSMIEGAFYPVLPALTGGDWTEQINSLFLAIHKQIDFHIALIHEMSFGGPVPGCQCILDPGGHFAVMNGGRGGLHMR